MNYSPEDRRKAAEQVTAKQGYGIKGLFECAIDLQCQLNAAVELLRRIEKVTGYADIVAFLADFPVPEVETKR